MPKGLENGRWCTIQVPPPPVRWGGEEGEYSLPEQDLFLGPPPEPLGDALGPLKGLLVHPLENTRTPNCHTPIVQACPGTRSVTEGANPEVVGIPLQRPG